MEKADKDKKGRASDSFFHLDKLKGTVLFVLLSFAFVGFQVGIIPWVTAQTFEAHVKENTAHLEKHETMDKEQKEKLEKRLKELEDKTHKIDRNVAIIQADVGHIKTGVTSIQSSIRELMSQRRVSR
tara:strand:+ start:187 stop:567 length:381 start_codon:yes stop_codon:yes gene_type:complete